jgi:hypothetical protein
LQKNVSLYGVDRDDDPPVAGDGGSTSMSEHAHDEELLMDWNDTARLTFSMNLLILKNRERTQFVEWD